jgi:Spy/CpxP family protein refolding chaperone
MHILNPGSIRIRLAAVWWQIRRRLARGLLVAGALSLTLQPVAVAAAAQPAQAADGPVGLLMDGGERYLDSASMAMALGLELVPLVEGIQAAAPETLDEAPIIQARELALALAEQAAAALGSVDDLADGLAAVSAELPGVADVAEVGAEGFPGELEAGLIDELDIPAEQVAEMEAAFQGTIAARLEVAGTGLPPAMVAHLQEAGFNQAEIEQVASALATRGVANGGLQTRLDQFRAGQDELASARSRALALYVQLLGRQMMVRQAHGVAAEEVSEVELEALAQDELRLLIHAGHLQALWGEAPDLAVGEGDWWFIERYAGRAAERLTGVILAGQNRGLAVDLLALLQLRTLAVSAQAGDPDYAKAELDRLAALVAYRVGDPDILAQAAGTRGLAKLLAGLVTAPGVRERVSWPVPPRSVEGAVAANQANLQDANPSNDALGLAFAVGFLLGDEELRLDMEVALEILDLQSIEDVANWLEVIVGFRDPENVGQVAVLVLVSFIPLFDVVNDLVTLVRSDDVVIRVLMLFSVVASLGELFHFLGFTEPLGAASTVGDSFIAVTRGAYSLGTDDAFKAMANTYELKPVFSLAEDFFNTAGRYMVDEGVRLGDDAAEVVETFFTEGPRLWDDFVRYWDEVNAIGGARLVLALGYDEGGQLVGQIARLGPDLELSEPLVRYLDDVGDGLYGLGIRVGDDSASGLARVVGDAGEDGGRGLLRGLNCAVGFVPVASSPRGFRLASPLAAEQGCSQETLDIATRLGIEAVEKWTSESVEGLGRVVRLVGEDGAVRLVGLTREGEAFRVVFLTSESIWDEDTIEGLARMAVFMPEGLLGDLTDLSKYSDETIEGTLVFVRRVDLDEIDNVLIRVEDPRDLFSWRNAGNTLDPLESTRVTMRRQEMPDEVYQSGFKRRLEEIWNNGESLDDNPRRLAEVFALESGIDYFENQGYRTVYRAIQPGTNGPDVIMRNVGGDPEWLILEGKGTYTGAPLEGSSLATQTLGYQTSREWVTNSDRYISSIPDEVFGEVQEMINALDQGAPYQVVIARGGIGPSSGIPYPLEYGSRLSDFTQDLLQDEGIVNISFIFNRLLPPS